MRLDVPKISPLPFSDVGRSLVNSTVHIPKSSRHDGGGPASSVVAISAVQAPEINSYLEVQILDLKVGRSAVLDQEKAIMNIIMVCITGFQ
jgi:hypothetical protein